MPKRTRAHEIEDLSRSHLHRIFSEVGWTVEDIGKDYGEDLLVRIFENGSATPLMFFVQAKATDGLARYTTREGDALSFPVKNEHLEHWRRFQAPVILTLWDSRLECFYWTWIQSSSRHGPKTERARTRTVRISIPRENSLDRADLNLIASIVRAQYKRRLRAKNATQALFEYLRDTFDIKIEGSPEDGVLIVRGPTEEIGLILTGVPALQMKTLTEKRKQTPQKVLLEAISHVLEILKEHEKTGKYPVWDRKADKRIKKKISKRELRRQIEKEISYPSEAFELKLNLKDELI